MGTTLRSALSLRPDKDTEVKTRTLAKKRKSAAPGKNGKLKALLEEDKERYAPRAIALDGSGSRIG
jgi:hypothetical protein